MAKRKDIFPSKYLKADDLAGKPLIVEIERASTETLGSGNDAEKKTVLYFRGGVKSMPLNMLSRRSPVTTPMTGPTTAWSSIRPRPN